MSFLHGGVKSDIAELLLVTGNWAPLVVLNLGKLNAVMASVGIARPPRSSYWRMWITKISYTGR